MVFQSRLATRRQVLRSLVAGGTGLAVISIVGCGDDDDDNNDDGENTGTTPADGAETPGTSAPAAGRLDLVSGWYRDQEVRYYDFGMNSEAAGGMVTTAPIYVLITGMNDAGEPVFVEGQHNIVDVVPQDPGYSDLWEVHLVTVPGDYEPDSIRSAEDVNASGFEVMIPGLLVNCPIVAEGTTLEGGEALVQGWYRDSEVFYPDFGPNPATVLPIFAFATGMDASGAPLLVEGQSNIIDSIPTDEGYSAFWGVNLVMVGDGYEANSIRSAADVAASRFDVMQTPLVVNCPVTEF